MKTNPIIMKKLTTKLILLFGILILSSCNEDFEDIKRAVNEKTLTLDTAKLIGEWQLKKAVLADGTDVTNPCFQEEIIEFKINGTYLDRRNQINPETNECEFAGLFVRGYNGNNEIFETENNEKLIATYDLKNKNKLVLDFIIPFEASVTYKRVK